LPVMEGLRRKAIWVALATSGLMGISLGVGFAQLDREVIMDPAGYALARPQSQAVPYSQENLRSALQLGGGQVFEITGDASNVRRFYQGSHSIVSLDLTTSSGETLQLQIPSDLKAISSGDMVRVLARVSSSSQEFAVLEVIGIVSELDLIAASVGLKDASQLGTIGWLNGYNPGPPSSGQPYLPGSAQQASIPTAPESSRVQAYKDLIASYNPDLPPQDLETVTRGVLMYSGYYGIQPALAVALFACESGFHPKAVSSAGAQGLGQLMPGTAAGLGVMDSFHPLQNVEASLRLLRGHLSKFTDKEPAQQLSLALACYNAGSATVEKYGGVPPYSETINYITKVSRLFAQLYQQGYR